MRSFSVFEVGVPGKPSTVGVQRLPYLGWGSDGFLEGISSGMGSLLMANGGVLMEPFLQNCWGYGS